MLPGKEQTCDDGRGISAGTLVRRRFSQGNRQAVGPGPRKSFRRFRSGDMKTHQPQPLLERNTHTPLLTLYRREQSVARYL